MPPPCGILVWFTVIDSRRARTSRLKSDACQKASLYSFTLPWSRAVFSTTFLLPSGWYLFSRRQPVLHDSARLTGCLPRARAVWTMCPPLPRASRHRAAWRELVRSIARRRALFRLPTYAFAHQSGRLSGHRPLVDSNIFARLSGTHGRSGGFLLFYTETRNSGFRRSRRTTRRPKASPPCANY